MLSKQSESFKLKVKKNLSDSHQTSLISMLLFVDFIYLQKHAANHNAGEPITCLHSKTEVLMDVLVVA